MRQSIKLISSVALVWTALATTLLGQAAQSTPPRPLLGNPPLLFPSVARAAGLEGDIAAVVTVGADGVPIAARLLEFPGDDSAPFQEVIDTLQAWRFEPATFEGMPVTGAYPVRRRFLLSLRSDLARMYTQPASAMWRAAEQVFRDWDVSLDRRDEGKGLLISDWRDEEDRDRGEIQYHVFVPPSGQPGRVYVATLRRTETAILFNERDLTEPYFEALETAVGESGVAIPQDAEARAEQSLALMPELASDECVLRLAGRIQRGEAQDIQRPEKVSNVDPIYPDRALSRPLGTSVVLEGVIFPDGFFLPQTLIDGGGQLQDFVTSAFAFTSLWRYRPTIVNGCPVPTVMTVTINFRR